MRSLDDLCECEPLPAGTRLVVTRDGAPLTIATLNRDATRAQILTAVKHQGVHVVGIADA